jgi:hypothetical protein
VALLWCHKPSGDRPHGWVRSLWACYRTVRLLPLPRSLPLTDPEDSSNIPGHCHPAQAPEAQSNGSTRSWPKISRTMSQNKPVLFRSYLSSEFNPPSTAKRKNKVIYLGYFVVVSNKGWLIQPQKPNGGDRGKKTWTERTIKIIQSEQKRKGKLKTEYFLHISIFWCHPSATWGFHCMLLAQQFYI